MDDFTNTLLISVIPAIFTGLVSCLISVKNAKNQIEALKISNKHEIEKLMKHHEIDLESLKEKHILELENINKDHEHKIEILELEHKNAVELKSKEISDTAMYGFITQLLTNPDKLKELIALSNNPNFKEKK